MTERSRWQTKRWPAFRQGSSGTAGRSQLKWPATPSNGRPGVRTWPVDEVLRTLHTTPSKALLVPVEGRDGKDARPLGEPMRTMTTRNETGILITLPDRTRPSPRLIHGNTVGSVNHQAASAARNPHL